MKRVEKSHIPILAASHPGMRRKNNEDRYAVAAFRKEDKGATPAVLAVLCDGIGGHRAGEVAAEMAVNMISQYVAEFGDKETPQPLLRQAIQNASQVIFEQSQTDAEQDGMGATCAAALVIGSQLFTANVGDSRIYLIRGGQSIRQVSTDHTWIQEALNNGLIQPDQVQGHPNAHVIRRFLGSPQPPEVDFRLRLSDEESDFQAEANQGLTLYEKDGLLLCSDGLSDLVSEQEILEILQSRPPDQAVESLVKLANERGGHDNITIVYLQGVLPHKTPVRPKKWLVSGCLIFLAALIVAGGILGGTYWFFLRTTPTPTPTVFPTPALIMPQSTEPAVTILPPVAQPTQAGTPTPTTISLPVESGPTLTPWPTNTPGN